MVSKVKARQIVQQAMIKISNMPERKQEKFDNHPDVDCMQGRYLNREDLRPYVSLAKKILKGEKI